MIKNIDDEINRLLNIKEQVSQYQSLISLNKYVRIISNEKYNELLSENKLDDNLIYFIVSPEIGQYIEEYIQ